MKTQKHTPTPWKLDKWGLIQGDNTDIANTNDTWVDEGVAEANAAYIVKAVNSHEALLKALKNMREDWLTSFETDVNEGDKDAIKILNDADEAIKQAEGDL